MAKGSKRRKSNPSKVRKPMWIEDSISKTTPPSYIGVCIEGKELFVGNSCHVRGGKGRDDEFTCEIDRLYEDINGEMLAKVRWFYWPNELKKLKSLPSVSPKEIFLSHEYSPIDVETISKKCNVVLLPSATKVPDKSPRDTLYCKWMIAKGYKAILPALPSIPQAVKHQQEEERNSESRATSVSIKRKTSPNATKTLKKKRSLPQPSSSVKIQSTKRLHKEDLSSFEVARERLHVSAVPESLPCRQAEFDQIYAFVELRLQEHTGGCMYISGMPGTGKTATVLEVVNELRQSTVTEGDVPTFQFVHLNGLNLTNPQQVFQVFVKQLIGKTSSAASAVDKLNTYFSSMEPDTEGSILLLVDELDMLWTKKQAVFYTIFEWCTWPDTPLILLAIANTMDLPERMLIGRVTSRLGLTRLEFLPYGFKQLLEILLARLQDLNVFERDAMLLAARKIAAMSGDARKALDVCRRATEIAEQQGSSRVGIRHIDAVVKEMFFSLKVMAVKYASLQEKLLLQSIQADLVRCSVDETTLEQVYSTYCNLCSMKDVMQILSLSELSSICTRLTAVQLLSVGRGGNIHQMLRLNISKDDLNYGLSLCTTA